MKLFFSKEQADTFNQLLEKSWNMVKDEIYLHVPDKEMLAKITKESKNRLLKAEELLQQAIGMNPYSWQSYWILGKIFQRLEENAKAIKYFKKALEIDPDQESVLREAGLTALNLGDSESAIAFFSEALKNNSNNVGLIANLSLAFLFNGNIEKSINLIETAISKDPKNNISKNIKDLILKIKNGKKILPKTLLEINIGY